MPHVVAPGETLWSIAAANNLTTRTVAAFNGLSESSQVVLGSTIQVPTTVEGYAALQKAGLVAATPSAPSTTTAAAGRAASAAAPPALGGYTVRPGDTLSGLAAGARVSVNAIAAENGLNPAGVLLAGTVIKLPTGAPAPRARRPARAGRHGRARGRARAHADARRRRHHPVRRRGRTASPPRSPRRSPGRRAASTTPWSPPPTRAA